ncbi:MAG: hypothetical protein JRE28_09200 [Deltaproteobacteria bacterium]|nr:hypothetical protein [Deltaproteobacteria bacterium]
MKKTSLPTNEKGSVVVLALIMLVLLTLLGMAVTRTSSIEVQIASNDQQAVDCLYAAESADHYAVELINTWMTNNFLMTADTDAWADSPDLDGDGNADVDPDIDGDGTADFQIEIRCIEATGTDIDPPGTLSDAANDLPVQQHITIPPIGSGYSIGKFEVRKYGITGTASNGCSVVQMGTYKVFNKFN